MLNRLLTPYVHPCIASVMYKIQQQAASGCTIVLAKERHVVHVLLGILITEQLERGLLAGPAELSA